MIDQSMRPQAVNDPFPQPDYPKDRVVSGAFILALGLLGLLVCLAISLAGLGLLIYGICSMLAAYSPWRS